MLSCVRGIGLWDVACLPELHSRRTNRHVVAGFVWAVGVVRFVADFSR